MRKLRRSTQGRIAEQETGTIAGDWLPQGNPLAGYAIWSGILRPRLFESGLNARQLKRKTDSTAPARPAK